MSWDDAVDGVDRDTPGGRPPRAWEVAQRLRRHAAAMSLARVLYLSGSADRGVRPDDTAELARCAGGDVLVIDGAGHLGSIKVANDEVLDWALNTFEQAEERVAETAASPRGSVGTRCG